MNGTAMLNRVRTSFLTDSKEEYLWSQQELVDHLNSALIEMVGEAHLIRDIFTKPLVEIPLIKDGSLFSAGTNTGTIQITTPIVFDLGGVVRTLPAADNIALPTLATQPENTSCRYVILAKSDLTVYAAKGEDVADLTTVRYPIIPSGYCPIALLDVTVGDGQDWRMGVDSLGDNSTLYTFESASSLIPTDNRVVELTYAKASYQYSSLTKKSEEYITSRYPTWYETEGNPSVYHFDTNTKQIMLNCIPESPGILRTHVYRLPLSSYTLDNLSMFPEAPEEVHEGLIDGVLYLAYSKQDAETEDLVRAEKHRARFKEWIEKAKRFRLRSSYVSDTYGVHPGAL
jgi:hypothetical protein